MEGKWTREELSGLDKVLRGIESTRKRSEPFRCEENMCLIENEKNKMRKEGLDKIQKSVIIKLKGGEKDEKKKLCF